MKKKIVFIDSGVGGLFVLKECEKAVSGYDFVYLADDFNAPYGNKGRRALKKVALEVVLQAVERFAPEMIVVACNTLTVNTISVLRRRYKNIKFVGVEPAIKTAKIYGGDTVVLATPATQKNYKVLERKIDQEIKSDYKKQGLKYVNQGKMFWVADENLAGLVEQNFENLDQIKPHLESLLFKEKYKAVENIVLGCTHYLALKPMLKNLFPETNILDASVAVATRAKSILGKNKSVKKVSKIKFIALSGNKNYERKLEKFYNLIKK